MHEINHEHKSNGDPHGGSTHQGHSIYWRRAHRDWRMWLMAIMMLAAMAIYLMTGGFSWRINMQPHLSQPISVPAGK